MPVQSSSQAPLVIYTGPLSMEEVQSTMRCLGLCYPTRQIVLAVRNPNENPLTVQEYEESLRVSVARKGFTPRPAIDPVE